MHLTIFINLQSIQRKRSNKSLPECTICTYLHKSVKTRVYKFVAMKYGNTGCPVFNRGIQNWNDFCLKKFCIEKRNHWILKIGSMGTVWPEPILIKVSGWWQIPPPQHQSTYLGGPESASIEIPPFRPHFIKFQKKFFFTLTIFFSGTKFFV